MASEQIRTSMENAVAYLTAHPDEARYTDSPATATIQGLRVTVEGADGESLITDMPASVGGEGSAPSPGWLLRAAVASCDATLIAMRAASEGIELSALQVMVDSESDDRGILGIDPAVPAGPLSMTIRVKIASPVASVGELRELVEWADRHCPVSDAVQRTVPATIDVQIL